MKKYLLLLVPFLIVFLALVVVPPSQADNIIDDHLSSGTVGPVGLVDESHKFDDGFYEKIQEMINTEPIDGAPNVYDGKIYYDIIFVVSRDDGDGRDSDAVSAENKLALVKTLGDVGALNVRPGQMLSFVTASVPVMELPGLSLYDEVFGIGDGALAMTTEVNTARVTINATPDEIRAPSGVVYNGSGVVVGVLDTGINHVTALNPKVLDRVTCDNSGCAQEDVDTTSTFTSHGTRVAQVLAATLDENAGIAPGVELLDVDVLNNWNSAPNPDVIQSIPYAHGLDWSLKNGADVVNLSFGGASCALSADDTGSLILNEAVDKGVVAVKSAGNSGSEYNTITSPGCSDNVITVGGIDDRTHDDITMYGGSSRGPVSDGSPRLKPDVVAPAVNIQTLSFVHNTTTDPRSGTSYAAPQVSATAAILLQAKPDLTPVEIKAAVLLGADWQAPIPCNSPQFERNNPRDNCSYIVQPENSDAESLNILNNVGFGILNVNQTLEYASERTPTHNHVMGDYLDTDTNRKQYTFNVADTSEPVKVILTWLVHPHGSITAQYTRSDVVNVADLGFTIRTPTGQIINADSDYQTNEFAIFNPPSTGTYTVTVTGSNLDTINKSVQNYALASTHSLTILPTQFLNRAPVAQSDIIIINPHDREPAIVRLTGADQNGDPISFSVSRDPLHGTVSTDEQITKISSRMFYNASSGFGARDTFEVTPQDGLVAGRPATITISAESLPAGAVGNAALDSSMVKNWDTLEVRHGYTHTKYSATFSGPDYTVSAIYLGSVNMEGVDVLITPTSGPVYTAAVPPSDDRMITFASPLSIRSIVLSADGLDEEAAHDIINKKPTPRKSALHSVFLYDDVRMFAGYVPASCSVDALSGAQGSTSSICPAYTTYRASSSPSLAIPDNSDTQDTSDTMLMSVNGTLKSISVSVDIAHTYTGDLKVEMTSPVGKTITLHNREGGGSDDIKKTYQSSTSAALKTILDTYIAGNWTLSIGDYAGGDVGVLNSWDISAQYEPVALPIIITNNTSSTHTIVFSDNFEDGTLAKWTETGKGRWTVTTSQAQAVPTIPGYERDNKVLHTDACDSSCTVTTKQAIDLSDYKSAMLSFWRFVDSSLDGSEYLKVDMSDGSSWTTILHWSDNNNNDDSKWHKETYDLAKYVGKSSVAIRFVTQQSVVNEDVQVDDVVINATKSGSTTPPPPPASAYSVYVADTDDYEILAYTPEGAYIDDIVPRKSGGLGKPFDIAFGPDGHLYVSDNTNENIRKYNGATGASLGKTNTNAEWASTVGVPNGMAWNGNALYVATLRGVEKISTSGSNLGYFGDASRNPSTTGAPALVSPYDVAFCPDGHMYVADRSLDKVLYYDKTTGKYKGSISNTLQSTQPDTDEAAGLKCGPAIYGTDGTTSLFQSGEDAGWINEINYSTKKLIRQFTSLVDEPYGMDSDAAGNLYVANKDDDNIIRISTSGTSAVFVTGSLDDPRSVIIGPKYTSSSSAESDTTEPSSQNNDGPELALQNGTSAVPSRMTIAAGLNITLVATATDPEGDAITLDVIPYAMQPDAVSITDYKNGTGAISINTHGVAFGTYAFMIAANDGQNLEHYIYTVITP